MEAISLETGEKTFRAFTPSQGASYAAFRPTYHDSLLNFLLNTHTSTGGQLHAILDVGCGPGIAIRALSHHFDTATGIDASVGMIETAQSLSGTTKTGAPITFAVSEAENLGSDLDLAIAESSIDLITSATAAHWFDMPSFWCRAAKVLKPGGSVAIWASGGIRVHPSMPGAKEFQKEIDRFQEEVLAEHMSPRNLLVHDLYIDLPLPWTLDEPVEDFVKESFVRKEWNTAEEYDDNEQFHNPRPVTLDLWEMAMGTASPVQRWREANKEKAGTEEDVVRITRRVFERILRENGVEQGKEKLNGSVKGVMLFVKKKL